MNKTLTLAGSFAGSAGAFICLIAGLSRVTGFYYLAGYQSTTIFMAGIGLMVFGCLVKLESLANQQSQP
jgi:hypothetical protein